MPLYQYGFGLITGSVEGAWKPYGDPPGPARLLSERARALSTGAGTPDRVVSMEVVTESPTEIVLRGVSEEGIEVVKRLTERRSEDSCHVEVEVTWRNTDDRRFSGELWLAMSDHTPENASRYQTQRQPLTLVDGSLAYGGYDGSGCGSSHSQLTDEEGVIPMPGPVAWFGLSDRYFGTFLLPGTEPAEPIVDGNLQLLRLGQGDEAIDGGVLAWGDGLSAHESLTRSFRLYLGPNDNNALTAVDPSLGRAIDLGWFAFFGYPLLWLLRQFHNLVGNWGIAIILLTLLVKLLFFPMTQKSFKSMQGMQKIQPELAEIKEKYSDDPQELNRRTLKLMQEHGVNPLSGCLPMVIQMPVWIALYRVLLTSVELYHTEFLYLRDLTEPDPYCILPVTITFLMWLQQQFSTPSANMDPVQQQIMRYFPLVFGLMFFAFPSGLAVYVFVNMTLSILQQWVIRRSSGTPPPAMATV